MQKLNSSIDPIVTPENKSKQWPQYLAVITACICAFSVGLNYGWTSPYIRQMLSPDYHIRFTSEQTSYIVISILLGYFVSTPMCAFLANRIGRKKTLLLIAVPQFAAWLILGFSDSLIMYCVGRAISGIPEAAVFALVPMYMGEICEPSVRGRLGTTFSISMIIGVFVMNLIGDYTTVSQGSFLCALVPVLFVVTFVWMPESPYYLIMKNEIEEARKSLKRLRRMENIETELSQLIQAVKNQTEMVQKGNKFKELFLNPVNRKTFFILLGLRTVQQMSGLASFSMYAQKLFQDAGSGLSPTVSTLILIGTQIVMTFAGSLFVDKLGRRPLFLGSSICTSFILATLAVYFYLQKYADIELSWLPVTGMVLYIVVLSTGLGVVPNLMMSELLSASIKSEALAISNMMFGIVYTSSAKLFQVLQDNVGIYAPFILYSLCCLMGFFFALKYVPETKGRTLEEIQEGFRKNKKPSENGIHSTNA